MSANVTKKVYQLGQEYEQNYRGCSKSAVAAIQDAFNIRSDDVFNIHTKMFGGPYYLADMDDLNRFEEVGGHDPLHYPEVVGRAACWAAEFIIVENLI